MNDENLTAVEYKGDSRSNDSTSKSEINGQRRQANWLDVWSLDELRSMQSQDEDIKQILDLKAHEEKPTIPPDANAQFKMLMHQWDQLHSQNGLLYRSYVSPDKFNKSEQLVAPKQLRDEILTNLTHQPNFRSSWNS